MLEFAGQLTHPFFHTKVKYFIHDDKLSSVQSFITLLSSPRAVDNVMLASECLVEQQFSNTVTGMEKKII